MSPDQRHEFDEARMDRRLATEQIELLDAEASAPCCHPAIRLRQVQIARMPVIGIVGAALTAQIAGVGDMQFQQGNSAALFGRANAQDTGNAREEIHGNCSEARARIDLPQQARSRHP